MVFSVSFFFHYNNFTMSQLQISLMQFSRLFCCICKLLVVK